jgi:hypothetical protein
MNYKMYSKKSPRVRKRPHSLKKRLEADSMSWDSYENEDGTITLCRLEPDERWGNWGEIILTKKQYHKWKAGDKKIEEMVWKGLR